MEYDVFRNVLTAFADSPVDLEHGSDLTVEVRDDIIEARVTRKGGDVWVEEDGVSYRGVDWIVKRIARLPILADRILTHVPDEQWFIEPAGDLLRRIEDAPDDAETRLDQVTRPILDLLNERPAGASTGVYLTSDAGEGKTTLIRHLARRQAQQYKQKETDWLLVPIALGGRPFLRFDDVMIGTLANTLRFPFLYYEAFVWLVRIGVIVPALDGFEEMFVEGQAGDAVSALGNLMQLLDSRGTILIAARSAYFEYKNLQVQASLFDSFHEQSADFARVHLRRWDRDRFITYAGRRNVQDGPALFDELAGKLKDGSHPLLTRAVLVKRLIDVASDAAGREDLIAHISADNEGVIEQFVDSIVRREAEKWIDRSGQPVRPLLTVEQHHDLLAEIALEMWTSETEVLKSDAFDLVVDLYAESCGMDAGITNQMRERIRQHALIVPADMRDTFRFDHEEFYRRFLGRAVARTVARADVTDVRRAFRRARLPDLAVAVAAREVLRDSPEVSAVVGTLNATCATEPHASFVKDNAGSLAVRLINSVQEANTMVVKRMAFPVDSLHGRHIQNAEFRDCFFLRTKLAGATMRDCLFDRCQFGQVDVTDVELIERCRLRDCQVDSVVRSTDGTALFAPDVIASVLASQGFDVPTRRSETGTVRVEMEPDRWLVLTERMCHAFFRSTGVNENTLRQRMSKDANLFLQQVLPKLVSHEVVREVEYKGSGRQRRYRLGVSLRGVQQSIEQADGSFEKFLQGMTADRGLG